MRDAGLQGYGQAHRAERAVDVLLPGLSEVIRSNATMTGVRIATAIAATFLLSGVAMADGALAITSNAAQDGVAYGFVRNFPAATAPAAALDTCRRMSNTQRTVASCRVVGMFTDQCFAIALVPQGGATTLAWAIDADRQAAQRKALAGCAGAAGDSAEKCKVVQARCDGSTWAQQCSGRNGVSPDRRIAGCTALIGSGDESEIDLVSDYVSRGNAHADRQDFDQAIADYGEALSRNPTRAAVYYDRAAAWRMKGDYDKAIADYDRAIVLNPRYEDAFVNRGIAYAGKGNTDRAISEFTTALMLDANDVAAYRNRGDAYVDKGDLALARDDYDEAIRRAPGDADSYRSRGYLHFYAGEFTAAADDLARVLAAEPDDVYAMLWAYLAAARAGVAGADGRLKQSPSAGGGAWPGPVIELLLGSRTTEAALAAASTPAQQCEAQFYIGEWKLLRGDKDGAAAGWQAAVESCPRSFIERKGAGAELKRLTPP
jgi:lipoprotein NlpI